MDKILYKITEQEINKQNCKTIIKVNTIIQHSFICIKVYINIIYIYLQLKRPQLWARGITKIKPADVLEPYGWQHTAYRQRCLLYHQLTSPGTRWIFCRCTSFSSSSYTISVINCSKESSLDTISVINCSKKSSSTQVFILWSFKQDNTK